MINLKEIENTFLNIEELEYIDSIIHRIYRERKSNIITQLATYTESKIIENLIRQ